MSGDWNWNREGMKLRERKEFLCVYPKVEVVLDFFGMVVIILGPR